MTSTNGILELRIKQSTNNFRIFYFNFINNKFILLHAIRKVSQKTPKRILTSYLLVKPNILKDVSKMNHNQIKHILFKDPEIQKEYDALEPLYEIQKEIIRLRTEKGLSQKDLADLLGTKQSAISRLENGTYNPSIMFLSKLAKVLDKKCHVVFK